jgi:hypothetical protein
MQNYHAIETEAAHRRGEWDRAIAAAALTSRERSELGHLDCWQLPHLALAILRSLSPRRLLMTWFETDREQRATMEQRRSSMI